MDAEHTWWYRRLAVCVLLVAWVFNSDSGRTVIDTKVDLVVNPGAFLHRALDAWDPAGFAGQLQNQASGYLFPMGPFFWLGHLLDVPPWVTQRLWWSALLCSAFLGTVVLCGVLKLGTGLTSTIAGVGYALSPHLITVLGSASAEALPMAVTPWVVAVLARGSRHGSPWRAGATAGLLTVAMGGINAVVVGAALVPAATFLLTRRPGPRVRRLAVAWVTTTAVCTLWWSGPLVLLGRYGTPFLNYIEDAATTTSTTSLVQTLRGTADWVPYVPGTSWNAGLLLLVQPALIINSVIVVILGLVGLIRMRSTLRPWLATTVLLGVVLVTFGHRSASGGWSTVFSGFGASDLRAALDGPLAAMRNVHKFDVVLRLPLLLAVADLLTRASWGRSALERRGTRRLVAAVAVVAVLATAGPLVALRLAPTGSYVEIPGYWRDAAAFLSSRAAGDPLSRTLVVPGVHDEVYEWGATTDVPLQPLAGAAWDERTAVPLSSLGHIRMTDAIEERLAAGQASAGFASYLAANGIDYLLVRNDLDVARSGAPRPALVDQAIGLSPGITRIATFGAPTGAPPPGSVVVDQHLAQDRPPISVWQVGAAPAAPISTVPLADAVRVGGGPESLLPLADAGLLDPETPMVLDGDATAAGLDGSSGLTGPVVLTDGLRRREINTAVNPPDASATLTASQSPTLGRPALDYLPASLEGEQSVIGYTGITGVTASSSAANAAIVGHPDPAAGPFAALDQDETTAWRSSPLTDALSQWWQVDFPARSVSELTIAVPVDSPLAAVSVTTAAGTVRAGVRPGVTSTVTLPAGMTTSLRVGVASLAGGAARNAQVALSEVAISGLHPERTLRVGASSPGGRATDVVSFSTPAGARGDCVMTAVGAAARPLCAAGLANPGEEAGGIDRAFSVGATASYDGSVTATPTPGPVLDALIARNVQTPVLASASSQAVPDPRAGPAAAVDGDPNTGWVAAAADPDPTLTVTLPAPRTVSSLRLVVNPDLAATSPARVVVDAGDGVKRQAEVAPDGTVVFAAVTTTRLVLHLINPARLLSIDPATFQTTSMGLGVSEVQVPGSGAANPSESGDQAVTIACGAGPTIDVGGLVVPTGANTTVRALRALTPVRFTPCSPSGTSKPLELAAGQQHLVAASGAGWSVIGVTLVRPGADLAAASTPAKIVAWGDTSRTISIAARGKPVLLRVAENANTGWAASVDGRPLIPVTLDGWQQGWVVPAGAAARVSLRFGPDTAYRGGLLAGGTGAGLTAVALLGFGWWRRRVRPSSSALLPAGRSWSFVVAGPIVGVVAMALLGGPSGLLVMAAVLGGTIWAVGRRGPVATTRILATVAAGAYGLAGAVIAIWPDRGIGSGYAATLTQVLCLVALAGLAIATLWPPYSGRVSTRRASG